MKVLDVVDQRVLGALRLLDSVTKTLVDRPLKLNARGVKFVRNLSHYYVMTDIPGLELHTIEFEAPPSEPPIGSIIITVTIKDPSNYYLPRTTTIALPRNPDLNATQQQNSLFRPADVMMYSGPKTRMNINWSVIRGSLWHLDPEGHSLPICGALLRVVKTDDETLLAHGLTDTRGEITVIVPGIPITNFSNGEEDENEPASGPVLIYETSVRLEVIVDPELSWPVDPDVLEANRSIWLRNEDQPTLLTLKTGRTEKVSIKVDLTEGS